MSKRWFITGTSRGFGRLWAEAALERGDRVVATARNADTLKDLKERYRERVLTLPLNVDDRAADFDAVAQGWEAFGGLDIVVNNAGYGQHGAIEEVSEAEARSQIETNLFGALWITQAALPRMRERGSGHIIQVSSIGGVNAFPHVGLYHASKWGLEGLSQTLAQEVAPFGIHVTIVEPIGYETDCVGSSARYATEIPAYEQLRDAETRRTQRPGFTRAVPEATVPIILKLVDMEAPPLRLFLGSDANEMMHNEYRSRLDEWDAYNDLSVEAHG